MLSLVFHMKLSESLHGSEINMLLSHFFLLILYHGKS